jgi:hypothetical protein
MRLARLAPATGVLNTSNWARAPNRSVALWGFHTPALL